LRIGSEERTPLMPYLPGAGDEAAELLDNYLNEWRAEKARTAALTERSAPLMPPDEQGGWVPTV